MLFFWNFQGVDEGRVEEADDADDAREAYIRLIMASQGAAGEPVAAAAISLC